MGTLSSSPFFSRLDDASRQRLSRMARTVRLAAGETVSNDGEPVDGLYVVASGLVRIYKLGASGKEHVLHFADPGKTFAEVAVLGSFVAPANAQACEPSVCVLFPAQPLTDLLRQDHGLCLQLLASMAFWVKHLVDLLEGIVLRDAASRVAKYLLDASAGGSDGARVALPSSKRNVASHLNLTSETFSRTLRQLKDAGIVHEHEDDLRIDSREGLVAVAEGLFPHV
jgi:CRP/FNR family transcriptional regulator, dissimilatory nitrate respiration regulator